MRSNVALYRRSRGLSELDSSADEGDNAEPFVPLEELLDDLTSMQIAESD